MNGLDKFSKYIRGTLPEEETEAFTREVVKDYFESEALKEKWNTILENGNQSNTQDNKIHAIKTQRWKSLLIGGLAAAASVLLLLFAWFSFEEKPAHQELLAAYISVPYQESISRKGPIEDLQNKALEFYNNKDYLNASTTFEKINTLDQSKNWIFYIGLCQLYQHHAKSAIKYFEQSLGHPDQVYKTESHWYLGLAHTMNNDLAAAKEHIEIVAQHSEYENGWNVQEAKALLKTFAKE